MNRAEVLSGLDRLRRKDRDLEYFGAKGHRYKLRPPLSQSEVEAFEARHGCKLPADYRAFVTDIANGGAGPNYGLYPLGFEHGLRDLAPWEPTTMGNLGKEFPHKSAWNLPDSFWAQEPDPPEGTPLEEEDRLMKAWDAKLESVYWLPSLVDGAFPISDVGCALSQILVVSGSAVGTVWADYRADYRGIFPLAERDGSLLTFSRWYETWLDAGLARFSDAGPGSKGTDVERPDRGAPQ